MFIIETLNDLGTAGTALIQEKITVPGPGPRISRPRLLEILGRSLASCTSTIISGRAGTGKTSLALDFARKCGRRVAWYKVDAADSNPKVFFQYLIASVQEKRQQFGKGTLLPLLDGAEPDIPGLADAFVYELAESDAEPLLIVIEDVHLLCDTEWLEPFFRRFLPLIPAEVHVLITSRTMPPAPLWRMRSKQTLTVIEEETLAFTRPEALELFASYGLSSDHANIALDHTHGRASALVSFATSLSNKQRRRVDLTADTRELVRP